MLKKYINNDQLRSVLRGWSFFGLWMIEELKSYGYEVSSGTIYPILHSMEEDGILVSEEKTVEGKVRKYYSLTKKGEEVLTEVKEKTNELSREII